MTRWTVEYHAGREEGWRWRLIDSRNDMIESPRSYASEAGARQAFRRFCRAIGRMT